MSLEDTRLGVINRDAELDAAYIAQGPRGATNRHALVLQQRAKSGAGSALNVNSNNPDSPAIAVSGGGGEALNVKGGTLQLTSDPNSDDDVNGGRDGTTRLNLESYQRANFYSYGETIRNFLRKAKAKAMIAWYAPDGGYDGADNPLGTFKAVAWIGAHWRSNDGLSNHKHISIETPDSTGALQTRLEVRFGDTAQDNLIAGLDKTLVMTNLADFVVRCSNGQVLRLSAPLSGGSAKAIEFSNDSDGAAASRRWLVRQTNETEAGSDAGSNFQIVRYNDSGVLQDSPIIVTRSTGTVTVGGTSGTTGGLQVNRNTSSALNVTNTGAGGSGILVTLADTASSVTRGQVTGDTTPRHAVLATGQIEWGSGAATRDVNLYRSAADVLKTDDTLHVGANLRVNTTSLGSGSGVVAIANASVVPSANPTGGGVMYVEAGALKYRGSSGTVTTIAPA